MRSDSDLSAMPRASNEGAILRCYKYMSGYWEDALKDSRLKLSAATEFNDIFDCAGACVGAFSDETIKRHLSRSSSIPPALATFLNGGVLLPEIRREYSERMARSFVERELFRMQQILCLSIPATVNDDILMWSHYADKWNGVRLGFDLLFENHQPVTYAVTSPYCLSPIRYSKTRPVIDLTKIEVIEGDPLYSCYYYDLLHTKSEAWKYECEWRLFCDEQYSSVSNGIRFWDFNKALLRTIDLGPEMEKDQLEYVTAIARDSYPHVEVRRVAVSDSKYDFEYRTIQRPSVELNAESTFHVHGGV